MLTERAVKSPNVRSSAVMPALDHILRFQPIFRRYLWGGRRLGTVLGKPIGPEDDYAESWELVDHGADQSVVRFGPLEGTTLSELVKQHGAQLFGDHGPSPSSFPLLMKLLDCNRTLSVQVHPNDEQAAKLTPPDLGKTEAWVVLAAEPGSKIYAGLKPGVTRETLAAALAAGHCETTLHEFEPRVGDCVFIPAGTIHALGAGLLIAEIQQASDTTFRLFDWNRVDAAGNPRALHVEESLATIDYARGPVGAQTPQPTGDPGRERLVECDKFVLDRVTLETPTTIGGDGQFHLLCVAEGSARAAGDPADQPLARGDVALLPAAAGAVEVVPYGKTVLLDICLS
jgi:mannose-6-phosphate isomerase